MGNNNTPALAEEGIKINHPKFNNLKIIQTDYDLKVEIPIQNDTDFINWQKNLNSLTKIQCETFLLPKGYEFNKKSICGSAGILEIDYESFIYILEEQINSRAKIQHYFQQEQLRYLLYSLVSSANQFEQLNVKIGDIRPLNIFMNESGQVKISNVYTWPSEKNNFYKTFHEKQMTYLAPEQFDDLRNGRVENIRDKVISQSFSIGLTMLHCCLLKPMYELYDMKTLNFDRQLLAKRLGQLVVLKFEPKDEQSPSKSLMTYSQQLKQAILGLCQVLPADRLSSINAYKWLQPFDDKIANLVRISIPHPPIKKQRIFLQNANNQKYHQSRFTQHYPQPPTRASSRMIPHHPQEYLINKNFERTKSQTAVQLNFNRNTFANQLNQTSPIKTYNPGTPTKYNIQSFVQPAIPQKNIMTTPTAFSSKSSDILKKIDEQLFRSRKMFPS